MASLTPDDVTVPGRFVKVRVVITYDDESLSSQHLGEARPQNSGTENVDFNKPVIGTLLLTGTNHVDPAGASEESSARSLEGFLFVRTQDSWSPPTSAAPETLQRLSENGAATLHKSQSLAAETSTPKNAKSASHLPVKIDRKVVLLKIYDIDWIASAQNSVVLHVGKQTHLLRGTLASIESRLPRDKFIRISRSKIVQIDRIKELELDRSLSGNCFLSLTDGTKLTLSRRYRSNFQELGLL